MNTERYEDSSEARNNILEEEKYRDAAAEPARIKAIKEGEQAAKEQDKGGGKMDHNPRIFNLSSGVRDKLNEYVRNMERRNPELADDGILVKIERLTKLLEHYDERFESSDLPGISGYKTMGYMDGGKDMPPSDLDNKAREQEILEIMDDPKVADVIERIKLDKKD